MICIFDPACELLPPWTKELYLCTVAPLLYLLSDLLPPFPNVQYIQTVCDIGGGGEVRWGVLICTVYHILQEFYTLFLTRFRTYKVASPPLTKITSKDDIKGLVSLKFLRPCWPPIPLSAQRVCCCGRGEDRLARWRGGWGGSIFWKTREIGLPSYSKICTLCFHLSTLMRILLFTSMRIRIHLSTLMRIRIRLSNLMRIRIQLPKMMRIRIRNTAFYGE